MPREVADPPSVLERRHPTESPLRRARAGPVGIRKTLEDHVRRSPALANAQGVSDFESLEPAFVLDRHLRAVKYQWSQDVKFVGAAGTQYTFRQAADLVTQRLAPLLFPH